MTERGDLHRHGRHQVHLDRAAATPSSRPPARPAAAPPPPPRPPSAWPTSWPSGRARVPDPPRRYGGDRQSADGHDRDVVGRLDPGPGTGRPPRPSRRRPRARCRRARPRRPRTAAPRRSARRRASARRSRRPCRAGRGRRVRGPSRLSEVRAAGTPRAAAPTPPGSRSASRRRGTISGGSWPALATHRCPVRTSSRAHSAVMNSDDRRSSTRIRFVRSRAAAGPVVWSIAAWRSGRAKAISSAAAMPLPVTSAMTTLSGRPRRRSRNRSKKSPPTSRAAS